MIHEDECIEKIVKRKAVHIENVRNKEIESEENTKLFLNQLIEERKKLDKLKAIILESIIPRSSL